MKRQLSYVQRSALAIVAGLLIPLWAHGQAAARPQPPKAVPKAAAPVGAPTAPGGRPGQLVPAAPSAEVLSDQPAELAKPINATVGKSILLRFDEPLKRVSVGNPNIADVTLISRRELYLLGKAIGGTNVMLWGDSGRATVVDVSVAMDTAPLASQLRQTLPNEKDIRVEAAAGSVVLSGTVSGAAAVDHAVSLAEAYVRDVNRALVLPVVAGDAAVPAGAQVQIRTGTTTGGGVSSAVGTVGARVVNLLRVREGQQVMLEVKVAEVNRSLLDKLGVDLNLQSGTGAVFGIISRFFDPTAGGVLGWANGADFINIYAQRDDGLVKLLAEPNIVAISGQEASFLAGGTVFLPVPQSGAGGGPATITLQERDFGVSVKFLPTVLGNGRINLKVQPEVSEPLPQGLQVSTGGTSSTLPAFASRRASTTVQLNDGQSLAIAGLIRSNMAQTVNAFPVLGDLPVLGPLFRSTNFRNDKTELLFVITPRLVRPLPNNFAMPTDRFVEPTRGEALVGSKMEGNRNYQKQLEDVQTQLDAPSSPDPAPAARQGGFEVK